MPIRPAKFGDIPRLTELMHEMHQRSIYKDRVAVDEKMTKALFLNCIKKHGGQHEGCTVVFVAERGGRIEGFIIGLLDRVYHVGDKLWAQDMYCYATDAASPRDASRLIDAYIGWAEANESVIDIKLSATDAIGDFRRTEKLYRRKGFSHCGVIYERAVG